MAVETVADRLRVALELADAGFDLMRQNLRRSHPGASKAEIERLLLAWIGQRPGAAAGDCPGRVRHLIIG